MHRDVSPGTHAPGHCLPSRTPSRRSYLDPVNKLPPAPAYSRGWPPKNRPFVTNSHSFSPSFAVYTQFFCLPHRDFYSSAALARSLSMLSLIKEVEQVPYLRFQRAEKRVTKANVWQQGFSGPTLWPDVWMLKTKRSLWRDLGDAEFTLR